VRSPATAGLLLVRAYQLAGLVITPAASLSCCGSCDCRSADSRSCFKTEEKGSDVNLATFLLVDALKNDAECFADDALATPSGS
jgi:hypothetical protein